MKQDSKWPVRLFFVCKDYLNGFIAHHQQAQTVELYNSLIRSFTSQTTAPTRNKLTKVIALLSFFLPTAPTKQSTALTRKFSTLNTAPTRNFTAPTRKSYPHTVFLTALTRKSTAPTKQSTAPTRNFHCTYEKARLLKFLVFFKLSTILGIGMYVCVFIKEDLLIQTTNNFRNSFFTNR